MLAKVGFFNWLPKYNSNRMHLIDNQKYKRVNIRP